MDSFNVPLLKKVVVVHFLAPFFLFSLTKDLEQDFQEVEVQTRVADAQ